MAVTTPRVVTEVPASGEVVPEPLISEIRCVVGGGACTVRPMLKDEERETLSVTVHGSE